MSVIARPRDPVSGNLAIAVVPKPILSAIIDIPTFREVFASFILKEPSGCHVWTGRISTSGGYGIIRFNDGRIRQAHRVAFALANGRDPELCICHSCDNRPCVNPEHLWEGSSRDNSLDMIAKGRHRHVQVLGDASPCAKITQESAEFIRTADLPIKILASRFSLSPCHISAIRAGRRWARALGVQPRKLQHAEYAPRGTRHHAAKLTPEIVNIIRSSEEGCVSLGRRLGVNQSTISRIRRGEGWSHVPCEGRDQPEIKATITHEGVDNAATQ